jgi:hypothetical protein
MTARQASLGLETRSVRERLWHEPPPDDRVPTIPPGARERVAAEVAGHIECELTSGRSLYRIVRDRFVAERVSEFDGRVLIEPLLRGEGR